MGRYIILKADIKDSRYVLINVYASNKDKDQIEFVKNLLVILRKENLDTEEKVIMVGDFNCPHNPVYDKKGGNLNQRKSVVKCIDCLQNELDLVDIWRIKNPNTKSYTWSQNSPKIFCRLDYWLISNNLNDLVKSTGIFSAIRADHDAITLDIEELKGSGFWKMNCSLLVDEEYVNSVTEMIPIWTAEGRKVLSDDRSTLDWIKYNIKHPAILHSNKKTKERDVEEKTLQKELNKAKEALEKALKKVRCPLPKNKQLSLLLRRKEKTVHS